MNVSLNPGLAKGYRTVYLDPNSGNGIAYRHEVHLLQKVQLVVCDDPRLGEGGVEETTKATLMKAQLQQAIGLGAGPLIPELGRQGYFFKGYHEG